MPVSVMVIPDCGSSLTTAPTDLRMVQTPVALSILLPTKTVAVLETISPST